MVPYQPLKQSQIDGTSTEQKKCVDACTVLIIDRSTVGRIRTTPDKIRKATGIYSRGITYAEAAEAAYKATKVTIYPMILKSRTELRDLVLRGRCCAVSIHTSVTRNTTRRTNYFVGLHSIFLNDVEYVGERQCMCEARDMDPHWEFIADDPGTTAAGFLRWSADLVYRAGEASSKQFGTFRVLASRDTEGVSRVVIATGQFRAAPSKTSKSKGALPAAKKTVKVLDTHNGGDWDRDSGGTANGWHRSDQGYVRGEALR